MGQYHIPHTEDLPMTTTPAMDASCFLLPYNYFEEDPSMAFKNSLRVEPTQRGKRGSSVIVERYGAKQGIDCVPEHTDFDALVKMFPSSLIDN